MSEFREVVHEWARRQLTERSGHAGPFEIKQTSLERTPGIYTADTFDSEETNVYIEFRHQGSSCPRCAADEAYRLDTAQKYGLPVEPYHTSYDDRIWGTSDTKTTVQMLNELLAIADQPG